MTEISIKIAGLEELNRKLDKMGADTKPMLTQATERAVLYVHSTVPPYPSPPSGSTYRRTLTLGRSITTEVKPVGIDIVGTIGTVTVYAPYVIDEARQAWMHKGRWWTLQAVVRKARDAVVRIYEQAIREWIR